MQEIPKDYAAAIGAAILALNTAEAEIFALLQDLGCNDENIEGEFFSVKIKRVVRCSQASSSG